MRLDFATFAFGYVLKVGGNTPNWATSLGQGKEHKINDDNAINEMLKGMVYSTVPLEKVSVKVGKGGRIVSGGAEESPIMVAAVFSKVYINKTLIENGKFILLITRDDSKSHFGRLRLKYGPSNTYSNNGQTYSNDGFLAMARKQLGLADDACWFFSDINIVNQDELILSAVIVNKNGKVEYSDTPSLHAAWEALIDEPTAPSSEAGKEVLAEKVPDKLSIDELGMILSNMYNSSDKKSTAVHMFGIKYGKIIVENEYTAEAIITASGIGASYHIEVSKGVGIYKSILANEYGIRFAGNDEETNDVEIKAPRLPILSPRTNKHYSLNSILYGAPGTGKTFSTAVYALAIIENRSIESYIGEMRADIMERYNSFASAGRIAFTTFHQSYGYEDFIQGIRPDVSTQNMSFKMMNGVFKTIAERAMEDATNDYVIVIDEINRANISKVFGELITLIEADKRWGEENAVSVVLPSGDIFAVPNNLFIIGTMNSADKSISLIDAALRRRFNFIEFVPKLSLVSDEGLRDVLNKLNTGIKAELKSSDLLVGHSYFMNKTIKDLPDIMNKNIIPLLYEYFFDDAKKVEALLKTAIEGTDVTILNGTMGRVKLKAKDDQ